jgi:hypothetical protein
MALFVVAYDLVEDGSGKRNYGDIEADLESMDSCRTQDSIWYVAWDSAQSELFGRLKAFLHNDDRLMVVEFNKRPSWTKAFQGTRAWLDNHFP